MAIVRLPQTKGEIEAATAELVYCARHDRWSTEATGKELGPTRLIKEYEVPEEPVIQQWLVKSARLGAMEKARLAATIELTLSPWSEDVRKLGAKRVVTIISRRKWQGALNAASVSNSV